MATVVTLNGRVDSIVPVDILWTQVSGPAIIGFADATDPDTTVTLANSDGTTVLRLTATTEDGLTSSDTVSIYAAANVAPTPSAGADSTQFPNTIFQLAGSATDDEWPSPHTLTYAWTVQAGTAANVTIHTPTASNSNVTITTAGSYTLRLTVSDGTLSAFDDVVITVSADPGTKYATATPDATPGSVTLGDMEYRVDLSLLDATWWNNMSSPTGADIRVTTAAKVGLPFDVINCVRGSGAGTGLLVYKRTVTGAGAAVRIYNGLSIPALAATDPNGQYNAYMSNIIGFWPGGGGNDRTINANHLTMVGSPASGAGPIGATSTTYGTGKYGQKLLFTGLSGTVTYAACFSTNLSGSQIAELGGVVRTQGATSNSTNNRFYVQGIFASAAQQCETTKIAASVSSDARTAAGSTTWRLYSGICPVGSGDMYAVSVPGSDVQSTAAATGEFDCVVVGARPRLSPNVFSQAVPQTLTVLYNTNMSVAWLQYTGQMLDQATFWNGWTTV